MIKPGQKLRSYNISEAQIRYAMKNSQSNKGAARFLSITGITYKKYAKQYIDSESGKSLYELHKNITGKGISRNGGNSNRGKSLEDILDGKHPEYPIHELKKRLMKFQTIPCVCSLCGHNERRITDEKMPLLLDCIDGDIHNLHRDNLRWLCYNCMFLAGGSGFRKSAQKYVYIG